MKKTSNRLSLNKLTVARLSPSQLARAAGGTVVSGDYCTVVAYTDGCPPPPDDTGKVVIGMNSQGNRNGRCEGPVYR